jgi:hypothetical protein
MHRLDRNLIGLLRDISGQQALLNEQVGVFFNIAAQAADVDHCHAAHRTPF